MAAATIPQHASKLAAGARPRTQLSVYALMRQHQARMQQAPRLGLSSVLPLGARSSGFLCYGQRSTSRSGRVVCEAKRRSFRVEKRNKRLEVELGETQVTVAEDQLWLLILPAAAVVFAATIIGPLVIGLAFAAVAVGAAFSAGAIAFTTLFMPMILFFGFGALMFGGLATALFFPKILTIVGLWQFVWVSGKVMVALVQLQWFVLSFAVPWLWSARSWYLSVSSRPLYATLVLHRLTASVGIAALGLGVGWGVVSLLGGGKKKYAVSESQGSASPSTSGAAASGSSRASSASSTGGTTTTTIDMEPEIDPDVLEQSRQLRDFDQLLAEREEEKRLQRWRSLQQRK